MGEYQATASASAPADALFDYLSDVANLPEYFARTKTAEMAGPGAVRTTAEVNGKTVEGEAWFKVDQAAKHLEWGSEGPNDYRGYVDATSQGDGSQVEVHISTERVESDQVQQGVDETVATIKRLVEGSAGGPPSA